MHHRRALTADSSLEDVLANEMQRWRERGLERVPRALWNRQGAEVTTADGPAVDFSSNDYLGLASDARIARALARAAESQGTGATASRLIAGTHPEHELLETELAAWFGAEAALTFATGFAANIGTIPALVGAGDLILSDALNHASLIDGCRLSRATVRVFPHRDVGVVRDTLERERARHRRALIVTDGMFSMDGDLAPLPDLIALARAHDAWTYVDDAHAAGVLGATGRGTAERLGVDGDVDVSVATLGKAFGVAGAFVHGSRALIEHLLNRARSFVFSTAMLPAQAAAARVALRVARDDAWRRQRVGDNARGLRDRLAASGVNAGGVADGHVLPVLIGDAARTVAVGEALRARGMLVGAIRPPTVAEGSSRLRISLSAAHTSEHVDRLAGAIAGAIGS